MTAADPAPGNLVALEGRVAGLESDIAAHERRLTALERASPGESTSVESFSVPALGQGFLSRATTLVGKVLLIFGGAFLLRSITDFQFLPTGVGILLGAAYALLWLFMAYRSAADKAQRASAVFYGGASILLALPLLIEAITRFEILSGGQGLVALSVFCVLTLSVAAKRDLMIVGWLVTAGGIVTGFVVLNAARVAVPAAVFLVILGLGSLWAVYLRHWMGPQWLGALGANAGGAVLVLLSASEQWSVDPLSAYLVGAGLLVAYLLSFALRTHLRGENVGVFEAVQAVVAVGIVFWAARLASNADLLSASQLGLLSLALGAGAYALGFTRETRAARGRNSLFYATLGLGLLVAGSALLMAPGPAAAAWSLMALALAWSSGRYARVGLSLQCTLLLLAAAVGSGVLATGFQALAGNPLESWPSPDPWHLIVAVTTVACLFIPVAQRSDRWGVLAGLPQLLVLALSVGAVGGLMVAYLAPFMAGVGGPDPSLSVLAAVRTAVLSAASVTLALSSRHKRWPEARWLVYPVLIVVGIKLFVEDFPNGQPATLFVALGLVGGALILVAKLLSRDKLLGS